MAAMYRIHVGGDSHRTNSRYYDVANIESRLLRHQVLTGDNRNILDSCSHSLWFRPVWHTGDAVLRAPYTLKGPIHSKGPHTP